MTLGIIAIVSKKLTRTTKDAYIPNALIGISGYRVFAKKDTNIVPDVTAIAFAAFLKVKNIRFYKVFSVYTAVYD